MHATREIQESLTDAVDEGMKMLQSFVNGTLTEGNNRDFYSWKREVGIGPIGKDFFYCYVITARSKYQHTAKY
jgi:hypothetical protein